MKRVFFVLCFYACAATLDASERGYAPSETLSICIPSSSRSQPFLDNDEIPSAPVLHPTRPDTMRSSSPIVQFTEKPIFHTTLTTHDDQHVLEDLFPRFITIRTPNDFDTHMWYEGEFQKINTFYCINTYNNAYLPRIIKINDSLYYDLCTGTWYSSISECSKAIRNESQTLTHDENPDIE